MSVSSMYAALKAAVELVLVGPEPVIYENDGEATPDVDTTWIEVRFQNDVSFSFVGGKFKRNYGWILFKIRIPIADPTKTDKAEAVLNTLDGLTNYKTGSTLKLYDLEPRDRMPDDAKTWFVQFARIKYRFDDR